MTFPIQLTAQIQCHNGTFTRTFTLNRGLTVLLGPNGSGKTHLLRGLKASLSQHAAGKRIRFLSAGRMGLQEQFRSDHDGQRGGNPRYDHATYGSKGDADRRHQMETINGDFQTLAARADIYIKVQERLRKLFKRDLLVEWDAGTLKMSFVRLDDESRPYSSGREASGLMQLVGILAALYDDEVGILLLDEPEVSLHPQLQAFLLKEILGVAGHPSEGGNKKIVIIATHSTEMVQIHKPDDLLSLVVCYDLNSDPVQIPANAGDLLNKKIQGLVARLGQEHKLSLFCKRPLLVEGPSDVMICNALSRKTDMHLEAAGSQLLPVIGKGQMPVVAKLLRLLGKDPVALADADGIADGVELINQFLAGSQLANEEACKLGSSSAIDMASTIFNDFASLVERRWNDISSRAETHPYWVNKKLDDEQKAKRRAAFCTVLTSNDSELLGLAQDEVWKKIALRLCALLDLLEKAGLFILRKGSIESYYLGSDPFTSIGKPSAAAEEMEHIGQLNRSDIETGYSDVIRCIKFASNAEDICEADALRDLLLAVVAPAHARMKDGAKTQDLNVLARSLLGDRSKLFKLTTKDQSLEISIESKILNVSGFPLVIGKDDDVFKSVTAALAKRG